MKKVLSNPTVAMILAVVVVLGTMLLSTKIEFGKKCDQTAEGFYTRTDGEVPIADRLREFCGAAETMVLLGQRYEVSGTDEAYEKAETVLNLLRQKSTDTEALFSVYSELLSDTFAIESALTRLELSEEDRIVYSSAQHEAAEAKAAMDASSYNVEVRAFLNRYRHFPTTLLAALTGVKMPQLFA
ncbi:MAG: hypothetical protein IKS55_13485 [Oscillospiraceae bacterium]|nr:hypothetical protein [Oscillospiraceae bacterium]